MSSVEEFRQKLAEVPGNWRISATKSGRSVEAWEPGGFRYVRVFTTDRASQWMTSKIRNAA